MPTTLPLWPLSLPVAQEFALLAKKSGGGGAVAIPNTCVVSTAGSDITGQRGLLTKPFATLQAAIDAALSGDTVLVLPGNYAAMPPASIVSKSISVVGWEGAQTSITFAAGGPAFTITLPNANQRVILGNLFVQTPDRFLHVVAGSSGNSTNVALANIVGMGGLRSRINDIGDFRAYRTTIMPEVETIGVSHALYDGVESNDMLVTSPAGKPRSGVEVKNGCHFSKIELSGVVYLDADATTSVSEELSGTLEAEAPGPGAQKAFVAYRGLLGSSNNLGNAVTVSFTLPANTVDDETYVDLSECECFHGTVSLTPAMGWTNRQRVRAVGCRFVGAGINVADGVIFDGTGGTVLDENLLVLAGPQATCAYDRDLAQAFLQVPAGTPQVTVTLGLAFPLTTGFMPSAMMINKQAAPVSTLPANPRIHQFTPNSTIIFDLDPLTDQDYELAVKVQRMNTGLV